MVGVCVDSNAQLPPELADRHGIVVVPLTIRVDGPDHLEGIDLDGPSVGAHTGPGTAGAVYHPRR